MTEAILHSRVRSWFGFVNQVSCAFSQAEVMTPSENYWQQRTKFYWDETLERLFQESKRVIVGKTEKGVWTFEMNIATGLATDYSKTCISYFLFQKHCGCSGELNMGRGDGHWKIILTGSCFTSDFESRYASMEEEALALMYGPNVYTWVSILASDSRSFTTGKNIFGTGPGKY